MAQPAANSYYSTGDIFIRVGDGPAFFTETGIATNAGKTAIFWPAGTPLVGTLIALLTSPNGVTSVSRMVYKPVTLQPGVPTKVCVLDFKGTAFAAPNSPNCAQGLKINLSKLPLTVVDNAAAQLVRVFTYANLKIMLQSNKLNIPFFEESIRFDPAQS